MNVRADPPAAQEVSKTPAPDAAAPARAGRRPRRIVLMASLPLLLALAGGYAWLTGGRYVETEDAYVGQAKAMISTDVSGRVTEVDVAENQQVGPGDVLFRIDPEPYRIALTSAEAGLAKARLDVEQLKVAYATAQAKLSAALDTLAVQKRNLDRKGDLAGKGYSSQSDVDQLQLSYQQALEDVALARQGVESAAAALDGNPEIAANDHPSVREALARVEAARLNFERTTVRAPSAGIVSQTGRLNVGEYAAAGTAMLALVATGNVWVEANLKETQLANVRPGQPAAVSVDAYPGLELAAKVASIGAGTGSEFSLIPAQNATGNWVKVVQRLPVRLSLAGADLARLRPGMSVSVSIDTGLSRLGERLK